MSVNEVDLYSGTGPRPPGRLKRKTYDGTFDSVEDARIEADRMKAADQIDWWMILSNGKHNSSWSSGLTGPRQRGVS